MEEHPSEVHMCTERIGWGRGNATAVQYRKNTKLYSHDKQQASCKAIVSHSVRNVTPNGF